MNTCMSSILNDMENQEFETSEIDKFKVFDRP